MVVEAGVVDPTVAAGRDHIVGVGEGTSQFQDVAEPDPAPSDVSNPALGNGGLEWASGAFVDRDDLGLRQGLEVLEGDRQWAVDHACELKGPFIKWDIWSRSMETSSIGIRDTGVMSSFLERGPGVLRMFLGMAERPTLHGEPIPAKQVPQRCRWFLRRCR